MSASQPPQRSVVIPASVLIAACIGEAVVLYAGPSSGLRVGLGLLMLPPIIWGGARLGVAWAAAAEEPPVAPPERRFFRLRVLTDRFLSDVRRLNWIAVVGEDGYRDPEGAAREMDDVEKRLRDMIPHLRSAAGEELPLPGEAERVTESDSGATTE